MCGLQECDYLECEFIEYANRDELNRHFSDNENPKGIILELTDNENKYIYSPYNYHNDLVNLIKWEQETMSAYEPDRIVKVHYWQLHTFHVMRIYKDEHFVNEKLANLKEIWHKMCDYKTNKDLYNKEVIEPSLAKKQNTADPFVIDLEMETETETVSPNMGSGSGKRQNTNRDQNLVLKGYSFLPDED